MEIPSPPFPPPLTSSATLDEREPTTPLRVIVRNEGGILLALGDHWTCSLLRAELIERGHGAACVGSVAAALLPSDMEWTRPVRLLVVDQATLSDWDRLVLEWLRSIDAAPPVALLASAAAEEARGPWIRVLRRPITIGAIAEVVDDLAGARATKHAKAPPDFVVLRGFDVRLGAPWPMILCRRCSRSRHCDLPRTPAESDLVRVAFVRFGLEHASCPCQ